jgi:pimeloyl-ACP methyl ester carboxylesterase
MPERRMVEVGGKSVRVLVGGSGPPLLYLHSLGGDVEWLEAHERLAARFTVYLPAHPGFADSTGVEQIDGVLDMALHYVDSMDALGLGAVTVVGVSFGGWIAAEVAALWPVRVARLVLVDAVGLWLDEAPTGELFGTTAPELAQLIFHDQQHPIAQMMHAMTQLAEVPEAFVLAQLAALEVAAKVGWNPYLHDPKLEGRLRRVSAPTLVLWGRQDHLVPLAHGERYRDRIRGARLEVVESCGHLPPVERPEAFAEAVLRFATGASR